MRLLYKKSRAQRNLSIVARASGATLNETYPAVASTLDPWLFPWISEERLFASARRVAVSVAVVGAMACRVCWG
jgi:diadenosine tetraphosphatase ApaH/serine/threonine PP2A family protein phosphatase